MKHFLLCILLCSATLSATAQKSYKGNGPDDVLQFVPLVAAYTLKVCGIESASSWKRMAINTGVSLAIVTGTDLILKHSIHKTRPDGTDRKSFPSGHTATAFAGATILCKEFGHVSPWIAVSGYAAATAVGIDRVRLHRHDWADVAAGAAIGTGMTFLGYWIGDKLTGERSRYSVSANEYGLCFSYRL